MAKIVTSALPIPLQLRCTFVAASEQQERVEFLAPRSGAENNPNRHWAANAAYAEAKLTLTITEPKLFGVFRPGREYLFEGDRAEPLMIDAEPVKAAP